MVGSNLDQVDRATFKRKGRKLILQAPPGDSVRLRGCRYDAGLAQQLSQIPETKVKKPSPASHSSPLATCFMSLVMIILKST